jgi:hypothetical protein
MTTNFFSPLSFVAVFGSGILDPGWVKIRIRDKHPGSATLQKYEDLQLPNVWQLADALQVIFCLHVHPSAVHVCSCT